MQVKEEASGLPKNASELEIRILNDRLAFGERNFLSQGQGRLRDRSWFRHLIYAPNLLLGYSADTFPAARQAIQEGRADQLAEELTVLSQTISGAADALVGFWPIE